MSASNLHMYVMAAPLLTAFLVNLFGRKSKVVIAVLTIGSLAFSSLTSLVVMSGVLSHGRISYTVGNWKPPYGIELVVDHLSGGERRRTALCRLLLSRPEPNLLQK